MEQMLVTQALDERDLLEKKIRHKIATAKLVDYAKNNESRTYESRMEREEFNEKVKAQFQQISDLIKRYQRIESAIIASNASSTIDTSFGTYTVAEAIALRNRMRTRESVGNQETSDGLRRNVTGGFRRLLADEMVRQHVSALNTIAAKNRTLETQAEVMRLNILGKDTKVREDKPLAVVDAYVQEHRAELLDPLDLVGRSRQILEDEELLLKELDSQIKISNATTMLTIQ